MEFRGRAVSCSRPPQPTRARPLSPAARAAAASLPSSFSYEAPSLPHLRLRFFPLPYCRIGGTAHSGVGILLAPHINPNHRDPGTGLGSPGAETSPGAPEPRWGARPDLGITQEPEAGRPATQRRPPRAPPGPGGPGSVLPARAPGTKWVGRQRSRGSIGGPGDLRVRACGPLVRLWITARGVATGWGTGSASLLGALLLSEELRPQRNSYPTVDTCIHKDLDDVLVPGACLRLPRGGRPLPEQAAVE